MEVHGDAILALVGSTLDTVTWLVHTVWAFFG
jgi:hypothetical protein